MNPWKSSSNTSYRSLPCHDSRLYTLIRYSMKPSISSSSVVSRSMPFFQRLALVDAIDGAGDPCRGRAILTGAMGYRVGCIGGMMWVKFEN